MKISMFGVGYVGLVTGACFAELGNEVCCCDIDDYKIENLKKGILPIYEPGLEEIVLRNYKEGRLIFTTKPTEAASFGDIIFIAVGTPSKAYGQVDLKYVYKVAEVIGELANSDKKIIVTKSTVPVGTNKEVKEIILNKFKERQVNYNFATVSNPEFLKEGDAIDDFMRPDRIVIGVEERWAKEKMEELYAPLTKMGRPILTMDIPSAEMTKYAANAMLATKISFINQVSSLCDIVGADVEQVRNGIATDRRIGKLFLYPGIGYGGSCFPKDVQGLSALAKKHGYTAKLIEAVEEVNEQQKKTLAKKVLEYFKDVDGKKIALWGLSFKPNTDDMRSAPSLEIIEKLIAKGAEITAYDPIAESEAKKILKHRINYAKDMYDALEDAEALIIATEWSQFKEPDFEKISTVLKNKIIFDGRNIYSPEKMKNLGFTYISIGRPQVNFDE